jgi:hypothetical protein
LLRRAIRTQAQILFRGYSHCSEGANRNEQIV